MTPLHEDPRVRRGMERQLERRRRLLDDGARSIGWKLGLGTPSAMETHGTTAPLVGFLTDRGLREGGTAIPIGDWGKPTAEPEVAVHLAADVPAGAGRDEVAAAIGGFAVAVELVDIHGGEVEEILAGDIFHRHVLLGGASAVAADELHGELRHGSEVTDVADPWAIVGDPVTAVAHLAEHLDAFGERARAGDVLITGSIVPALAVAPGDRLEYRLEPLGTLSIDFVE